jgi:transglutaminase-like putative cysteine protease
MTSGSADTFLQRARLEAERYGADPWVFVRELLQNARDAGAHRVWFQTSIADGNECVSCRDDGAGMTFDHAQRFLFSLYASSKSGRARTAGRFGIGFWSVLRFEPNEIVVRSQPQRGESWQVCLDGRLELMRREQTTMRRGTEVVLERRVSADDLEEVITASILRDAPWLGCRHREERPLEVRVNGRLVRAEPALPPPSMSFRRRGLRGVVGLGPEPRAEIFAHGFRVRDAATLDELLVEARPQPQTLAGSTDGLAPRIIIDSRNLEVLMARGDAREDRALKRLVAVGHRELGRLVRAELDRHAGLTAPVRLVERWREAWSASRGWKIFAAVVLSAALAGLVMWRASPPLRGLRPDVDSDGAAPQMPLPEAPYRDLWGRYRGPEVESLGKAVPSVDLSYQPAESQHLFAALWITGLVASDQPAGENQRLIGRYEGASCADNCLEVELGVDAPAGLLRLPVASSHVIDPRSVRLDEQSLQVFTVATGQPAVWLDTPRVGRLSYRSAPGRSGTSPKVGVWPDLPPEVVEFAHELEQVAVSARAFEIAEFVRRRVAYDTSVDTVARHMEAREQSVGLFARALEIGAGDCDVQNSLVAAMLDDIGIPSRLAVGWIGSHGRARPGLHAWAEYRGEDGEWRAVDASAMPSADRPAEERTSPVAVGPDGPPPRSRILIPIVSATALVLAMFVFFVGRRPWRRRLEAGDADDIVGLVRGAAVKPRSFEEIHALFTRRLLRLVSGRPVSLAHVRETARKGRLACGRNQSELARRAAQGGGIVLDLEHAESAAVADVLAAINLDHWQELLGRAADHEMTARVEDRLVAAGEACRILVADQLGSEATILDGTGFGLGSCWVVLDEGSRLWQSIRREAGRRPSMASLVLAEAVVRQTGVPQTVRYRILSGLALEALLEAAEVGHE